MRIGVIFPHFEFGPDPLAAREYALAAESLGYRHIGADDHIIGANPDRPGGWTGWVTNDTEFYEVFVLFGYLACATRSIEFETCVLLLPQRQTVLVAKQAATLDLLSGGRLRLGLGSGWSTVEYQSLGADMTTRGKRIEEQVTLLRRLWTEPHVDFHGRFHVVPNAGLSPLPVQRPIPIWFGGQSEPVIRRTARMGDGWMPLYRTPEEARPGLALLDQELAAVGRSRAGTQGQAAFGFEARIPYGDGSLEQWQALLEGWQAAGATHISLVTTRSGFTHAAEHIQAMQRFAEAARDYMD